MGSVGRCLGTYCGDTVWKMVKSLFLCHLFLWSSMPNLTMANGAQDSMGTRGDSLGRPDRSNGAATKEGELYIKKLFNKYGQNGMMTFEGFEHLLESLGIGKVAILDHDIHDHHSEVGFLEFHKTHNHTLPNEGHNMTHPGDDDHNHHHNDEDSHSNYGEENDAHDKGGEMQQTKNDSLIQSSDINQSVLTHTNHSSRHHHGDQNQKDTISTTKLPDTFIAEAGIPMVSLPTSAPVKDSRGRKRQGDRNRDRRKNKRRKNRQKQDNSASATDSPGSERMKRSGRDRFAAGWDTFFKSASQRQKRHAVEDHGEHGEDDHEEPEHQNKRECLTASEILSVYHIHYQGGITEKNFLNLCPAIIYQIDEHTCHRDRDHDCPGIHDDKEHHCSHFHGDGNVTVDPVPMWDLSKIPSKVWGYAAAAVTFISLVGLVSVALVPVMQKACYTPLLQFLIALAVGSLTGDALLHLIPHALSPHEESDHEHRPEQGASEPSHNHEAVWKGMMVLGGIYFFFLMERCMGAFQDWRRHRRKKKRCRFNKVDLDDSIIGEKLSRHDTSFHSSENIRMIALHNMSKDSADYDLDEEEVEGHKAGGQGHSHGGHGHSHGEEIPQNVADIAWMVIMGDGLHNFCDGLAIGAGFASSITGGLSTTVAVFCHELPHELGDFAVLLSAGMSVKQALIYNIVSSVLCFIGMVIGICLGNISSASFWIFCGVGGMFIYISLVDMLPEITQPTKPGQSWCCNTILHILGIGSGISIMLVIALYEDKILVDIGS